MNLKNVRTAAIAVVFLVGAAAASFAKTTESTGARLTVDPKNPSTRFDVLVERDAIEAEVDKGVGRTAHLEKISACPGRKSFVTLTPASEALVLREETRGDLSDAHALHKQLDRDAETSAGGRFINVVDAAWLTNHFQIMHDQSIRILALDMYLQGLAKAGGRQPAALADFKTGDDVRCQD